MLLLSLFYRVSTLNIHIPKDMPFFGPLGECASLLWRPAVDPSMASPSWEKLLLRLLIQPLSFPGNPTSSQCKRITWKDILDINVQTFAIFSNHVLENLKRKKGNKHACTHTHHFSITQKQTQPSWLKTEKSDRRVLEIITFPGRGLHRKKKDSSFLQTI